MLKKIICAHRKRMLAIVVLSLSSACSQHNDYMDQGQLAYQQESYEVAISHYSMAAAEAPTGQNLSESLRSLSNAYKAEGKGDEAAASLVRAMKVVKYCLEKAASGRGYCPVPPWEKSYTPPFPK